MLDVYFIIRDIGTQVQLRKVRRPNPDVAAAADQTGLSYTEFQVFGLCFWSWALQDLDLSLQDHNGDIQPIHKYYKRYPYSG